MKISDFFDENGKDRKIQNDKYELQLYVQDGHWSCSKEFYYMDIRSQNGFNLNLPIGSRDSKDIEEFRKRFDFLEPYRHRISYNKVPTELILQAIEMLFPEKCCCGNKIEQKREERACPHCRKMNDVGVIECWNCCYPNP